MRKMFAVMVMVASLIETAWATPITVYDGKDGPRGTQIYLLSPSSQIKQTQGFHLYGPTESYLHRRDARHLRQLAAAEKRLQEKQRMLTPAEARAVEAQHHEEWSNAQAAPAPAEVLEKLGRPAPVKGGIKMGRFGNPETPEAADEPAPAVRPLVLPGREPKHAILAPNKPEKAEALVATAPALAELKRVVIDPRTLPVFKPGKVTMPAGYYNFGTKESPFTAQELIKFARRGVLGMVLTGDTVQIHQRGNQRLWLTIEPAVMDSAEFGGIDGPSPDVFPEWEPTDAPAKVRLLGGRITFRPGVVQAILAEDKLGRGSKSDSVLRQVEVVETLRKKCRTDRGWGAILARLGIGFLNGLGIRLITGSTDGMNTQIWLDTPKWECFSMMGAN